MASLAARSLSCVTKSAMRCQVSRSATTTLKQRQISALLNQNTKSCSITGLLKNHTQSSATKGLLTRHAAPFPTIVSLPSIAQVSILVDSGDSSDVVSGDDDGEATWCNDDDESYIWL